MMMMRKEVLEKEGKKIRSVYAHPHGTIYKLF